MPPPVLEVPAQPISFAAPSPQAGPAALSSSRCSICHLRGLCLPCGMTGPQTDLLDRVVSGRCKVRGGQALYRQGEDFGFIYALRSGTFKSSLVMPNGREQIGGFSMAGEVLGLDGVAQGRYASSATALEDSEVCAIPYARLSEISAGNQGVQQMFSQLLSAEIVHKHTLMLLLGSMNAEERLAEFLLNLSRRFKALGYSPREFHLRMTRAEIGSYLGMKLETVSRTFSLFQQQRLLEVDKRHVRIVDLDGLRRVGESPARG